MSHSPLLDLPPPYGLKKDHLLYHSKTLACCISANLLPVNFLSHHLMTNTYHIGNFCLLKLINKNQAATTYRLA